MNPKLKLYWICVLIGLLAGCAGWPAKAASVPLLSLAPCTVGTVAAECGTLRVPEDRTHPEGRSLELKVVVVRAYGVERQPDPLFYIVGGPGLPVTRADIVETAANYIFEKVNAHRDLVFLDQRGTHDEHRLACEWPSFSLADAAQPQVDEWMKGCLAGLDGDPRFYTTAPAMQDLDDARAALGYDQINLYGISYGAAAAQVYMRMFPGHVRSAVLDHGTALDLPFFYAKPRASQAALDQVFTYCDQDERCHAVYPDLRADVQAIFERLAKGPVVTRYTPPGETTPATETLLDLEEGVHQSLYDGDYGKIPFMAHLLATSEDWTSIVEITAGQPKIDSNGNDNRFLFMANMIFCFEPAWGTDPSEIACLNPGSYYLEEALVGAQVQQKICAALPKPDPSLIYSPGKPAPLSALMFNSLLDPQNPPSNQDLALQEFTRSRVVVEPTVGHNPSAQDTCRWDILAQYVEQGSVEGLDTSCLEKIRPTFLIGN